MLSLRTAAAICSGTYHIQQDIACQDAVAVKKWPNGACVVLCDGAGSCRYAREGAQCTVETVAALLEHKLACWLEDSDAPAAEELIAACLQALSAAPWGIQEQSCTLLFAASDDRGHCLCGHIGDGYIFKVSSGESTLLSDAENGDSPNETVFITALDAATHLRLYRGILTGGESLILCSDGAGDALYQKSEQKCATAVAKIGSWLTDIEETEVSNALYRGMDQVFRQVTPDDMSVAILSAVKTDGVSEENTPNDMMS